MPGNTFKGSRNIKGKTSRKSSRSKSRRNSRSKSKNTKEETFVEAILSDMPRASSNLTKMDQAMGNRTQTGLINPQNIEYDPLHVQYMVQQSNDMSHLNKYAYSADQIMSNQMGAQQMMPQMGAPQMMPQMDAPQMMPQMGAQPMMFGSREDLDNVSGNKHPEDGHSRDPEGSHPEASHSEASHPEASHPVDSHPGDAHPEGNQDGGGDLVELLAEKLRNNSLSNRQLRQLKKILH